LGLFGLAGLLFTLPRPTDGRTRPRPVDERTEARLDNGSRFQRLDVLVLRSPGPPEVAFRKAEFLMGASPVDVLDALVQCRAEPYGHRCSTSDFAHETPERLVRLSAFQLDRREVSVAEYARCVGARRCDPIAYHAGASRFALPDLPQSLVKFDGAQAYCRFVGKRLPTEAEFERAARGTSDRRYPWGDQYNSHASNHGRFGWDRTDSRDGYAELAPVDAFQSGATPRGVLNLAGNVAEWVSDRYAPAYAPEDTQDPKGPKGPGDIRVIRGGSYESAAVELRSTARSFRPESYQSPTVGFRCARSSEPHPADDGNDF
jgi:formylglycine-generating enzyme required for sulfatase activity